MAHWEIALRDVRGSAKAALLPFQRCVHALIGGQDLLHQPRVEADSTAIEVALTSIHRHNAAAHCRATCGEVSAIGGIVSGLVVAHSLVAASQTNSLRMMLLDFLSDQADLGLRLTLEVVAVDRLAVEGLTNRLDVFLKALVREAAHGLIGLGGRA